MSGPHANSSVAHGGGGSSNNDLQPNPQHQTWTSNTVYLADYWLSGTSSLCKLKNDSNLFLMLPRLHWIRDMTSVCSVQRGVAWRSACCVPSVKPIHYGSQAGCILSMHVCHLSLQLIKEGPRRRLWGRGKTNWRMNSGAEASQPTAANQYHFALL